MREFLVAFKDYLQDKGFYKESIKRYVGMLRYFFWWQKSHNRKEMEYGDLLDFMTYCQKQGKSAVRINKYLLAIRHYLDSQIQKGIRQTNPAKGVQVRGIQKPVKQGFLSRKELDALLEEYTGKHRLLLSLVVYQGLTLGELEKVAACHLNLQRGTIYIASGRKSSARTLGLEASQILPLASLKKANPGKLFGTKPLGNTAYTLSKELQSIHPKVRNLRQLRGSVIVHWLETGSLRETQYKAGHKRVVSTEKYLREDLEGLKQKLARFHPLNESTAND